MFDAICAGIGRKVVLVANYVGLRIAEALSDAYFAMVEKLHVRHYSQATCYAASAFMGEAGRRAVDAAGDCGGVESKNEAMTLLGGQAAQCLMGRVAA